MTKVIKKLIYQKNIYGLKLIECESVLPVSNTKQNEISVLIKKNTNSEENIYKYKCNILENAVKLELPKLGKFWIENGNRIVINHNSDIEPKETLPFLYSYCIGVLLYQREMIPLHGSAILTEKGAILFIGPSRAGKSLTAAALSKRGFQVISDDICAIKVVDNKPVLVPSNTPLMLWKKSLKTLDISIKGLQKVRGELEKYYIPVNQKNIIKYYSISKIYILQSHNKETIELSDPLKGKEKYYDVKNNTYQKKFISELNMDKKHFTVLISLLSNTEVKAVKRPTKGSLNKLIDIIEKDIACNTNS